MEFSRQEYWSELPFPPPGDLPNPGIEPVSLMSPALAGGLYHCATWETHRPQAKSPKIFLDVALVKVFIEFVTLLLLFYALFFSLERHVES